MTRTLVGGYVNFGVFALYGDSALTDALDITKRLAFSIPLEEIMVISENVSSYQVYIRHTQSFYDRFTSTSK
jgi:exportin-7